MSQTHALRTIPRLHAALTPPTGATFVKEAGGNAVYTITRKRSRGVPVMEYDERVGREVQAWKRNSNGDKVVPLYEVELYDETLLFYLESDGQNNVAMVPYVEPSVEELADRDRKRRVAEMKDALAEAVVQAGLTPEQVLQRLMSQPPAMPEPEPEPEPFLPEYPKHEAFDRWVLSNGEKFKGSRVEAEAAEAALAPALTPDY
jgi:hypothetical protein